MEKIRRVEIKDFEIDKEKLDKVMETLGELFGNKKDCKCEEGQSYKKKVEDFFDKKEEDEAEDFVSSLLENMESLELRVETLEEEVKRIRKALVCHLRTKKEEKEDE